jgi:hypothetical protein
MKFIKMFSISLVLTACATQNKSVGLGAALGGGTGAFVGSIADPGKRGENRTRNVILGSTVGAMTGMIAGNVIHEDSERKKKEAFLKGQASAPKVDGSPPSLSAPRVETRWIEGRVQGNRYIEGHFEYLIIEPARWDLRQ